MAKVANDTALAGTLAEARALGQSPQVWTALVGAGLIVGLTGPFGTYGTLPVAPRIGYWLVVTTTTFWIGLLVSFAVASSAERRGVAAPVSVGIGAVVASLPISAWLAALHTVVFAASFGQDVLRLLPYVTVIAIGVAALHEALETRHARIATAVAAPAQPGWLERLPHRLGRDLILLEAQDHYVRAETTLGDTLVRTTIYEAAEALGDHGIRVHRSWWVARAAIDTYRYRAGGAVLVLRTGQEVPVGRTYRRAVKQALHG